MLALIYIGLAIALGDFLCRRFYRFVSFPHRCAAATLVGILLSTWFGYLARLAFAPTSQPLLLADLLFFLVAPGVIFWLSRKAPNLNMIAPRAPGSSTWDWITLGALFAAACVLLIGTLYVDKNSQLHVLDVTGDLAPQLSIAQTVALGQSLPTELLQPLAHRGGYQFPFYFQAGNLEFLGLNLAWSVDLLSLLGLTSLLALVMALGELLFNSRLVGRLGAALFFFHGSVRHLTSFLPSGYAHRAETWGFWKQIAFVNQRQLPLAVGIFLLVLIFLVDWYRRRSSAKSFLFSGLLVAAVPLWNIPIILAVAVMLFCVLVAYGLWWLSTLKTPLMLGRVLAGALTACILAAGLFDLLAVYRSSRMEVNYETESLVKGLVFRRSVIYKIPGSLSTGLVREGSSKTSATVFEGGHGRGKGQFDNPCGLAVDSAGNIFVADTNNARIQKFSPNGTFVTSIGRKGKGPGQLEAPNGIAIGRTGKIYVADASNHQVQKLAPDGRLIAEWSPALYGPRRIAIGPDDSIYVVDSGRSRVVRFNLDGEVLATWGREGSDDGQFRGISSVAVDPSNNKVYVADSVNSRIQVFDSNGKFLTKWSIPEWGQPIGFEDLAVDHDRGRLYTSSAHMSSILVFDLQGNRLGTLTPSTPDKLDSPSALALTKDKLLVLNSASARISVIDLQNR
jgi:DNA-binding beta-propeller fold protein YncE